MIFLIDTLSKGNKISAKVILYKKGAGRVEEDDKDFI